MVRFKIWKIVCNNLIKAIENVQDETTELIVVPFAFDNKHHPRLNAYKELATAQGKQILISKINKIKPIKNTMTYHSDALKDFCNYRINPERVNYIFFMTDGQNEEKPDPMPGLLCRWGNRFNGKSVYGFYVMLHEEAANPKVDSVCKSQAHLWKVATADVNINLVRLQSSAIFNAKNDRFFDLQIACGDTSGKSFGASFPSNCPYKVKKTEKRSNSIRVWVEPISCQKLPVLSNNNLIIRMTGGGPFDFLVTEKIPIRCEFKPERSLKISVR